MKAIVSFAIAAGIAAFTAVLASYAILTRELNRGYLATNPASATLRVDAVDDALLAAVAKTAGVRDVEARRVVSGRIKGGTNGWRNMVLFVAKDFPGMRIGRINPEGGAWPPATGEILIERDAFQVARAKLGDVLAVRTANGPERRVRVSGRVHDVGQAQARMENVVYAYATMSTLEQLGERPYFDQLKIVVNSMDKQRIETVVDDVKRVIESRGHTVLHADIPEPGKHPHADIMGLLLIMLSAFGLFVMLLSGIIVVNLLTAIMAAQIRQIGVMKAIGGTRWQIARIYFRRTFLLGCAAIVVAVPAGVWGSRLLCRAMAVFLNFDIGSFAIPAWVFVCVLVVGLVIPLLAAARPVWKGSGVSVREALSDFGIDETSFGASRLDRMLAGVSGAARPILLAIRNNFRRRARLVLTVFTLAFGGVFFMTALNVRASMIHTLDRLFGTRKYDLSVALRGESDASTVTRIVRNVAGVQSVEAWRISGDPYPVIAVPPETRMLAPEVIRGRWLRAGDTDAMVINSALAAKKTPLPHVVGVVREPFAPSAAYVPLRGSTTNSLRVLLAKNDAASIDRAKSLIEEALAREGIRAASISSKSDSRFGFDQHMVMIYVALIIMSALIAIVGGCGLMTTMSINVLERRREMGVLRAIGATPRTVALMLASESVVVGFMSWLLASVTAWPLSRIVGNGLLMMAFRSGLDFEFALQGPLIWLVVCLLLGVIASVLPAWHASRQPVREALGYE